MGMRYRKGLYQGTPEDSQFQDLEEVGSGRLYPVEYQGEPTGLCEHTFLQKVSGGSYYLIVRSEDPSEAVDSALKMAAQFESPEGGLRGLSVHRAGTLKLTPQQSHRLERSGSVAIFRSS